MELSRFGFLCSFCLYLAKMVNMCNTDQTYRKKIQEFPFRQLAPKTPSLLSRPRLKTFPTQSAHILLPICMCCFLWLPTMEPLHDGNLKIKFLCVSFWDFLFQFNHWQSNIYIYDLILLIHATTKLLPHVVRLYPHLAIPAAVWFFLHLTGWNTVITYWQCGWFSI